MAATTVGNGSQPPPAGGSTMPAHLSIVDMRRVDGELFAIKVYVPGAGARWVYLPNRLLTVDAVDIAAHVLQAIAKGV